MNERETDLDSARGLFVLEDGVPDETMQAASRIAPPSERYGLFGGGRPELDGWRFDSDRQRWVAPAREEPFDPVRSGLAATPSAAAGGALGGRPSSEAGTQQAEVRAAIGALSAADLQAQIKVSAEFDRWVDDPDAWRWRWDRRVLYIGRAVRRGA